MIKRMAEIIEEAKTFAQTEIIAHHLDELKVAESKQAINLIDYYILQGYTIIEDK